MNPLTIIALLRLLDLEMFGGFVIIAVLVGLLTTVFWIMELVDVLRREFPEPTAKIVWVLVILFTHALGAIIYYFVGKQQGRLPGSNRVI